MLCGGTYMQYIGATSQWKADPVITKEKAQLAAARVAAEARQKAQDKFAKNQPRDSAFIQEKKRIEAINAEKTARLRGLRLAKEAAEREVAEKLAAEKAARPKRTRSAPAVAPSTDEP